MLKERDVARFIVAPDGYGKTTLAIEYAETMFSWAHTYWLNAQSPCFIRDIDAHDIASSCLADDPEARLVVFDDVPALEPTRMEAFSREIDTLLEAHCEVVVTCVPTSDMMGGLQRDRIRIDAFDMLLDDAELDDVRTPDERTQKPAAEIGAARRIPALAWATDENAAYAFAKSALYEELPSELLLAVAMCLVLQSGSMAGLLAAESLDRKVVSELQRDYPHLGFDGECDRFEAPPLSVAALATPLRNRITDLVARSRHTTPEELVFAWADLLVGAGKAGRACDLVREACPRRKRASWLIGRSRPLLGQACFFPALRIARDRDSCKGELRARLSAVEALCRMMLGDGDGALRCAKRHAFDLAAPYDVRILSELIVSRLGTGTLADKVNETLEAEASMPAVGNASFPLDWKLLAQARCASRVGVSELAQLWCAFHDEQVEDDVLCICASWLFGMIDENQLDLAASPQVRRCEDYIRARLRTGDDAEPDYLAVSAGLALEEARDRGARGDAEPLEATALIYLRKAEMSIVRQRRLFDEDVRAIRARRNDLAVGRGEALPDHAKDVSTSSAKQGIPTLTLRLFGRFEARIGDVPLEPKRFGRRNARTLLMLLAVNQGRELSRQAVERAMWPQSSEEVAHKNFYAVWSSLRRALTLPDGTCPYLVRHQFACRLEMRYVQSDVERLSEICRELLFGAPSVDGWSELFAEIDRDFSSDLVPAESKNRLVVQARNDYRTRLVDALVAATMSIIEIDNPQWGVWFARAAISHDETREDAYVALMRAQIAGNQRTAAMMTYLRCRRVLADELGIDPSPETTLLYESLLDAE